METVRDFIFLDSKITADGDGSHEIRRHLFLGSKAMTNLGSILKSSPCISFASQTERFWREGSPVAAATTEIHFEKSVLIKPQPWPQKRKYLYYWLLYEVICWGGGGRVFLLLSWDLRKKITKIRETGVINAVSRIKQNTSGVFICHGSHFISHLLYGCDSFFLFDSIIM